MAPCSITQPKSLVSVCKLFLHIASYLPNQEAYRAEQGLILFLNTSQLRKAKKIEHSVFLNGQQGGLYSGVKKELETFFKHMLRGQKLIFLRFVKALMEELVLRFPKMVLKFKIDHSFMEKSSCKMGHFSRKTKLQENIPFLNHNFSMIEWPIFNFKNIFGNFRRCSCLQLQTFTNLIILIFLSFL